MPALGLQRRYITLCAGEGSGKSNAKPQIIDSSNEPHSLDLWDFTLAVNLTGTFNLTRLALKHMVNVPPEESTDGERGIIIFVASSTVVSSTLHFHSRVPFLIFAIN